MAEPEDSPDVKTEDLGDKVTPPSATPPSEKQYPCQYCGKVFSAPTAKGTHVRLEHKEEKAAEKKQEVTQQALRSEEEIQSRIALEGRSFLNTLKKERLAELLLAPRIPTVARDYVLTEWDRNEVIRDDPKELHEIITRDAGVDESRSIRIIQNVFTLEQKYGWILEQHGERVVVWPAPTSPRQHPAFFQQPPSTHRPPEYQQRDYGYAPQRDYQQRDYGYASGYAPPPPQYMPPVNIGDTVRQAVKDGVESLTQRLGTLEQRMGSLESKGEEKMVVSEEPVMDFEGKPITDDQGRPIMRRIARPLSAFGSGGSQDNIGQLFRRMDQKFDDLKQPQQQGETPAERELRLRLESTQKTLEQLVDDNKELRQQYESNKDAAVQAQLQRQEKDMADLRTYARSVEEKLDEVRSSRSGEGYKEDSYRLLATAAHDLSKKEPIKVIIEGVKDIVGVTPRRREERTDLANLLPAEYVSES